MTGAVYIPMAKALDLWGRAEGILLMTGFCILGIVMLAASHNLATYCAGQVRRDLIPTPSFLLGSDVSIHCRYSTRSDSEVSRTVGMFSQPM